MFFRIILALFLTFFSLDVYADNDQLQKVDDLIAKANELPDGEEKTKIIDEAVDIYSSLIASGYENKGIHYNIGNLYAMKGSFGLSIWHFKKSLSISSDNLKALNNLDVVRKKIPKFFKKSQQNDVSAILFFVDEYQLEEKEMLFHALLLIFLIAFIIHFRNKHAGFKMMMAVSLVLSGIMLYSIGTHEKIIEGVVLSGDAYVYQGNGSHFKKTFDKNIPIGTEFTVVEQRNNWTKVQFDLENIGWMHSEKIKLVE